MKINTDGLMVGSCVGLLISFSAFCVLYGLSIFGVIDHRIGAGSFFMSFPILVLAPAVIGSLWRK